MRKTGKGNDKRVKSYKHACKKIWTQSKSVKKQKEYKQNKRCYYIKKKKINETVYKQMSEKIKQKSKKMSRIR